MACPVRGKRVYKFLGLSFELPNSHEWEVVDIGVHMVYVSDDYKIKWRCKHCDKRHTEHFVDHERLLKMGYKPEELKEFRGKSI